MLAGGQLPCTKKRAQAEAGRDTAEGVAAGAEGQGEGQGQRAAEGPRADPFNVADVGRAWI